VRCTAGSAPVASSPAPHEDSEPPDALSLQRLIPQAIVAPIRGWFTASVASALLFMLSTLVLASVDARE
jgi:hypothetical protein